MKNFIKGILLIGLLTAATIWKGYVLSVLWDWFIVPIFNVQSLPVAYAIGFMGIFAFLTYKSSNSKSKDKKFFEKSCTKILNHSIVAAIVLGEGWILTLFL